MATPEGTNTPTQHIVVLGSGGAARAFLGMLKPLDFKVTVISVVDHFLFTPLLGSVLSGTVKQHHVCLPFVQQPNKPRVEFIKGEAVDVDATAKVVKYKTGDDVIIDVNYDYLIVSTGGAVATHGTPGVHEYTHFYRTWEEAKSVVDKIYKLFEEASDPNITQERKEQLLRFVCVGGGAINIELLFELVEYVRKGNMKKYEAVVPYFKCMVVEAAPIMLGKYGKVVSDKAINNFEKMGVDVLLSTRVKAVEEGKIVLITTSQDGSKTETSVPYGMVIWAAGVGKNAFTEMLRSKIDEQVDFPMFSVNERLQVIGWKDVYALGDCCRIVPKPLAAEAAALFEESKENSLGAGNDFMSKKQPELMLKYPQVADASQFITRNDMNNLTIEEFEKYLQQIDDAYTSPPPTLAAAVREATYLSNVFNQNIPTDKPASCVSYTFPGANVYVGNEEAAVVFPGGYDVGFARYLKWKQFLFGYLPPAQRKDAKLSWLMGFGFRTTIEAP